MWLNILGELIVIGVFVGCVLGLRRAWQVRRSLVRWSGALLALIATLLFATISVFAGIGLYKLYVPLSRPVPTVKVAGTAEQIARGEHLANVLCAPCHSLNSQLPLSGGEDIGKASPVPIGAIVPPNLTPGGDLKSWADGEILRAVRDGIDRYRRPLLIPIKRLRHLSDDDLQAIIAYLRSQPAIENNPPRSSPSLLLILFFGTGLAGASPVDLPPLLWASVRRPKQRHRPMVSIWSTFKIAVNVTMSTYRAGPSLGCFRSARQCCPSSALGRRLSLSRPCAPALRRVGMQSSRQCQPK